MPELRFLKSYEHAYGIGLNYWLLQDRSKKEVDGFCGEVLRYGSLPVWLKLSHKS